MKNKSTELTINGFVVDGLERIKLEDDYLTVEAYVYNQYLEKLLMLFDSINTNEVVEVKITYQNGLVINIKCYVIDVYHNGCSFGVLEQTKRFID